jgi:hypothetical protein
MGEMVAALGRAIAPHRTVLILCTLLMGLSALSFLAFRYIGLEFGAQTSSLISFAAFLTTGVLTRVMADATASERAVMAAVVPLLVDAQSRDPDTKQALCNVIFASVNDITARARDYSRRINNGRADLSQTMATYITVRQLARPDLSMAQMTMAVLFNVVILQPMALASSDGFAALLGLTIIAWVALATAKTYAMLGDPGATTGSRGATSRDQGLSDHALHGLVHDMLYQ